ncbi:MAG TPA: hypothetical protein VKN76_18170, partial [Kiloniellaceae bacterium]|nr:hypothetical protein [Kiloniellaceae bacterium]
MAMVHARTMRWTYLAHFLLAAMLLVPTISLAQESGDEQFRAAVQALSEGSFNDKAAAIDAMIALGDPRAAKVLEALGDGDLAVRKSDDAVVLIAKGGSGYRLTDPVTGEALGDVGKRDVKKITVNNKLRGQIRGQVGALALSNADPAQRLAAVEEVMKRPSDDTLALLRTARETETVAEVQAAMDAGIATLELGSDDKDLRLAAVKRLSETSD